MNSGMNKNKNVIWESVGTVSRDQHVFHLSLILPLGSKQNKTCKIKKQHQGPPSYPHPMDPGRAARVVEIIIIMRKASSLINI